MCRLVWVFSVCTWHNHFSIKVTGLMFFSFQLIDQIGFNEEPYHLVGMSMGGALAGLYAAQYTHEVHSVTMICPASK